MKVTRQRPASALFSIGQVVEAGMEDHSHIGVIIERVVALREESTIYIDPKYELDRQLDVILIVNNVPEHLATSTASAVRLNYGELHNKFVFR